MNERIKELRRALKLSQEKFGARIKISGASISKIESGENNPSDQTLSLIAVEFGVSESWLREGVGEMFVNRGSEAERLVKRYSFPEIVGKLLTAYEGLTASQQETVLNYARRVVAALIDDDGIEARVEAYRQELLAEKEGLISSVSPAGVEKKA